MKSGLVMAFLIGWAFSSAGEPNVPKPARPVIRTIRAPQAWLGLDVSKPDGSITAHLPSLPPGIGFVIRSIDEDGPAQAAGLQEFDVVWKLGDQMLVNEGQLAALLRLSKPGDEILLSGFRAGKPLEVKLKLGQTPAAQRLVATNLVDSSILPEGCSGPIRVVNVAEKLASYSTGEGRIEVRKDGETYKVKIQGPKDEIIYEGDFVDDGSLGNIPENWQRRVSALRRGLDLAIEGRMIPNRQPRPRVVPPPQPKP